MKIKVKTTNEVEVKTLIVDAGVRYWEDSSVDGVDDDENGLLVPCKDGKRWRPIINLQTGIICNWEQGKTANIHYKVCDDGIYKLTDGQGNIVLTKEGYVPNIMSPKEQGYGDYIIMDIDADGKIVDWKVDLSDFSESEDQ